MILSFLLGALGIAAFIVILALLIGLEIALSNRDAFWPGLILPGILILFGLGCYLKVPGYSPFWLLVLWVPAALVLVLYAICRTTKRRFQQEEALPEEDPANKSE